MYKTPATQAFVNLKFWGLSTRPALSLHVINSDITTKLLYTFKKECRFNIANSYLLQHNKKNNFWSC